MSFRVSTLAMCIALTACAKQEESADQKVANQQPASPAEATLAPKVKQVSDSEAAKQAKRITSQTSLELADGINMQIWASEKLLADPVALSMDYDGNAWVAITHRSNNSEFDIRPYPHWLTPSQAMTSVEDRRAFLKDYFGADKNLTKEDVPDRNKDGVHDWQDLAVVKEEVLKISDTTGNGTANKAETFLEDFNSEVTDVLGGIYYHNEIDELFLGVAPHAWRVKDSNGDGVADDKQQLSDGFGVHIGFSGHGMSGVTLGPDGRIYYGIGDIGANITDNDGNQYEYPNRGVVVRSELDGSNFEIFAHGVRNTHEFVFDKYGNLITVDNDGDHPGEYERLVYLVDGSDSGWRINWQFGKYTDPKNNDYKVWMDEEFYKPRFDNQAAHILPPVAPYHAGPTGMVYHPGTGLSERWKDHFFVVEYTGSGPRSGINAFTLKPNGASFELNTDEKFMRGVQSTGLDIGPDGALYTSDWIEGWGRNGKGRIWKIDADGSNQVQRDETKALLQADLTQKSVPELVGLMGHVDMRVRSRAQFELVNRGEQSALAGALASEDQMVRIHAIWGIGQFARKDSAAAKPLLAILEADDPEIRAQAARTIGDAKYSEAIDALVGNLQHANARVRFFATEALGRIANDKATAPIIDMLLANNDEDVYLRQAGAIALARIGNESALANLADHESEALRVAAVVALRRLASPELARFLEDSSQFVVTNAARAINDDLFVQAALPALAELLGATPFQNEELIRRVINANAFVAGQAEAERLAQYASDVSAPAALRAEALSALTFWESPSVFDRVSGRYRGERTGDSNVARSALGDIYVALLNDDSAEVRVAAVNALGNLRFADASERLVAVVQDDVAAEVRLGALNNLHKIGYEDMQAVVYGALNDKAQDVRMAALAIVPDLDIAIDTKVDMHTILLAEGTVGEKQAAYKSLSNIKAPEAYQVLAAELNKLKAGDIVPAVKLELVNAAEAAAQPELTQLLAEYEAAKDQSDPIAKYAEALEGGDASNGFGIFSYNSTAQCVRCHIIGPRGSKVGPELTDIGSKLTREQLLESMVAPGARIAPGYGRTTVTLQDGSSVDGLFEAESETTITVKTNDGQSREIARADIAEQSYSPSGMPPMGLLLDKGQLRDLVEYLHWQRGQEKAVSH
ncbi:HEAT repeat domain-containing protein [Gilvimarinus sp. SDUM040013]|uniref:HEAT repeat domain-containing protein n=1 Tax=Gilvimarinus gilvus TaxID=3058038 RepID=A0ABU4RTW3_9GAMM|nr:HEAT repeat domain-containing protein [Gilvimarinus sp. SDUM040013]MDO3386755.1 HEAT repeat domain-containing protein [Gilvimarinus sp. SDUM040013]MDX6848315.1 HEAT repeat domain-containing protein [Gilvimarinus sp. SDUM040013]